MSISNWKISIKLLAAFGAVVATIATLGAVVYFQLMELDRTSAAILAAQDVNNTVDTIEQSIDVQESNTRAFLVYQNQKYLDRITEARETYNAQVEMLKEQLAGISGADKLVATLETVLSGLG